MADEDQEALSQPERDERHGSEQLQLYRTLGRMEQAVSSLARDFSRYQRDAEARRDHEDLARMTDQTRFVKIESALMYLTSTVDRIRKPVDTFLSLRNLLIGIAAIVAAAGAILGGVPHILWGWIHPSQ